MTSLERLMLDHCQPMLLLVEPADLRIAVANRAVELTLGYAVGELSGKPITDIESSLQDVFYWEDVRNGQYLDIEAQEGLCLCADGSLLPVRKTIRVVRHDGAPLILIQAVDIRNECRIEEDLAQTSSQLRATLEATGNGILVIDWKGRVASMNRLLSRMWQIPDELLMAEDDEAILHFMAGQVVESEACLHSLHAIADNQENTELFHLTDGRVFECKSRPQYLGEHIIGRVWGFNDITDHIRIARELIIACDRAESASRAKTDFLAMMSHEIRTPMNGVVGMTTLLLDTPLDAEQRRYLETIRSSADALLSILNDILDFSKVEAGKLALEEIDFDLLSLVEEVSDFFALRAAEKRVEFVSHIAPEVPLLLRGDPGRIRQIFNNLIGNAIKFTDAGSISMRLSGQPDREGRVVLRAEIRDTGIGIPRHRLDDIFQPFEQVDSSTTRKYGGTGLGLAITRQLVESMGGKIEVESQEGEGTCFRFSLVLESQAAPAGIEIPEGLQAWRGTRVLVVDDHPLARDNLISLLTAWGLDPVAVADAGEAVARVEAEHGKPFRCALIDLAAPGAEAETLGRRLRDNPDNAGLALVLCTPAGYRGEPGRLQEAGYAAEIHKPIRRAALLNGLLAVLGGLPREAPAPRLPPPSPPVGPQPSFRFLVVEDNAINMAVMRGILTKLGHGDIDTAVDGQEALAAAAQKPYDLILMDCQMPRMDGYEATRRLRASGIRTPILALTAHALSQDREKCLEAGMNDYLTKPIEVAKLVAAINHWLAATPGASVPVASEEAASR